MELFVENHSMYPRVGEEDEELRLRRAHHEFDRGDLTAEELQAVEDSYTRDIIQEQEEVGLDVVTDGMIRWYDHISHLARGLEGAEVAGLVRFFDTNYLVREARITGELQWTEPILRRDYEFAHSVASKPVKVILSGPYTMARHSILEDSPYTSIRELAEAYAVQLNREAVALADAQVPYLQIDEPSLLQSPEEASWILPLVGKMLEGTDATTTQLATYFGDAAPVYDELQEAPVDRLVLDFSYSDSLKDVVVQRGSEKPLALGLLNGRNTRLVDQHTAVQDALSMLKGQVDGSWSLSFTCSLDFLPRDRARRKLRHLSRIRDGLVEGAVQV